MRKILSIILTISILCTMAITPVVAEDVPGDDVVVEEGTGEVVPEEGTDAPEVTPEEGEDPVPDDGEGGVTEPTPGEGEGEGTEPTPGEGEGEGTEPTPGEGEGEEDEPVVEKTEYYVHHTLPSLLNADPSHYAGDLIATNQETIKVVFTETVGEDFNQITFTDADGNEPIGGVSYEVSGNTVTLKFGELKVDTEYKVTVPETMVSVEGHASTPEVIKFKTLNRKHLGNVDFSTFEDGTYAQADLTKNGLKITGTGSGNATLEIVDGVLKLTKTKAKSDSFIGSDYGTRELEYQYTKENEDGSTEIATGRRDFNNLLSTAKIFTFITTDQPTAGTYTESGTEKTDYGENFMMGAPRKSTGFSTAGYNVAGVYDAYHLIKSSKFTTTSDDYLDLMIISSIEETDMSDDLSTTTVKLNGTVYNNLKASETHSMKEVTNTLNTGVQVETGSIAALKAYSKATGVSANIKSVRQGFYLIPAPLKDATYDADTKTLTYVMNTDVDVDASSLTFGDYATELSYNEETRELSLRVTEDLVFSNDYTFDFSKVVSTDGIKGRTTDTVTVTGNADGLTSFGVSYTLPSQLDAEYGKNIAVNQETIKVVFAENIVADTVEDVTFVDANGNAPIGGIFKSVSENTLTIKFGELAPGSKYTLRLPTSIKGESGNIFEGKTLVFNVIGQKVLIDHDFSNTEIWPRNTTYTYPTSEQYFTTLNPNATGYFRLYAKDATAAGKTTLEVTEAGALKITQSSKAPRMIGSNFTAIPNAKIIADMKIKANAGLTASGDGLGGLFHGYTNPLTGDGITINSLAKNFSTTEDGFYDVRLTTVRKETAVNGSTVTFSNSITGIDKISGKSQYKAISTTADFDMSAEKPKAASSRIATVKSYNTGNDFEIASLRQGFFTIPAPVGKIWDAETHTLSYVMNTDIDMENSTVSFTGFPAETSYDAETRTFSFKSTEDYVFDCDVTVDLTGVVSVDGFECKTKETVSIEGDDVETFGYTYTLPSRLNESYGKNIPANLGEIKVAFAENINADTVKGVTFVDADGNAPKGGIFKFVDGNVLTVKFGELVAGKAHYLRLPTSILSESGKVFEGQTIDFNVVAQKTFINHDFSDTTKWVPGTTYTAGKTETYLHGTSTYDASTGYFRVKSANDTVAGKTTLKVTENGTLNLINGTTAGDVHIGSNFSAAFNVKFVGKWKFKANVGFTGGGDGFGGIFSGFGTPLTGNGLKYSDLKNFSKTEDGFYDITIYADRIETGVDGNNVTFANTVTAVDNISGKTIATSISSTATGNAVTNKDADSKALVVSRFSIVKSNSAKNDIEFASINNGFYTIPAPVVDPIWDAEAKTLTYVVNTDIDMANSGDITIGDLATTATYDEATRTLTLAYEGEMRNGYDYTVNFKDLVSVDGFKAKANVVFNNGLEAADTFTVSHTLPTNLHTKKAGNRIGVNQEEIKVFFPVALESGYEEITFTDANENAPKGGYFVSIDESKTVVTVKFGELEAATTYKLYIPSSVKSEDGKYIAAPVTKTFKTIQKVLTDVDFSDEAFVAGPIEVANNTAFSTLYPEVEGIGKLHYRTRDNGVLAFAITENKTLSIESTAAGNSYFGSSYLGSDLANSKVVTNVKFAQPTIPTPSGTGFAPLVGNSDKNPFNYEVIGNVNGLAYSDIRAFAKDANNFHDVTFTTSYVEDSVEIGETTSVYYKDFITARDNLSKQTVTSKVLVDETPLEADGSAHNVVGSAAVIKVKQADAKFEIASIKQGFYSIPAPISEAKWDAENKTVSYVLNTEIDLANSDAITFGDLDVTATFDDATRTLTLAYTDEIRNGYDYKINFTGIRSVDGFYGEKDVVFNNGEEKEDTFSLLYTLPSRLNGTNDAYIGPNQEEITLVFSEDIASGVEDITFTDSNGNAPKGGIVVTANKNVVTVKFGELDLLDTVYTVKLPSTLLSVSGKYVAVKSVAFRTMPEKEILNVNFKGLTEVPEGVTTKRDSSNGTFTVANDLFTVANKATESTRAGALLSKKISTAKVVSDITFAQPTVNDTNKGNGIQFGGFWKANFNDSGYNFRGARFKDMADKGFTVGEDGLYNITVASSLVEKELDLEAMTTVLAAKAVAYDNVSAKSVTENYTSNPISSADKANVETNSYSFINVHHADESVGIASVRSGYFTMPAVLKAVQDKEANTITLTMNTDIASGYDNITVGNLTTTNVAYNEETRELVLTYDGVIKDGYNYVVTIKDVVSEDGFKAYNNYTFNNGLEKAPEFKLSYTLPSTLNGSDKQYIGVNQETITLVFDEEPGELYKDITFTDANGNAPIGGVIITKDANKVTLKFGELALNTTYTVRLPELLASVSGKYVTAKTVSFTTLDVKDLLNENFAEATAVPSTISKKVESGNSITVENGMLTLANTAKADTKAGVIFDKSISSAKIISNVKYAEPTINETDKGSNLTLGGIWKSRLNPSGYTQKGISVSDINKVGFTPVDGLYDVTIKTELNETALNLETGYTSITSTVVAYDNISAKVANKKNITAELPTGTAIETNSYTFGDVYNVGEAISFASAKVGFYVMPAALTSEYDADAQTYTYVMNTDMNAETIANITVNGEAATATYNAETRTIVVSNVPADATVNFYRVYSVDGFEVEISDKTPVEEPVTFALANNAVTVADGVANFSFDYTNDVEKTVQVVIAEYHGNKLAKVEVKDVTLGVTTNEAVTYTTPEGEGFALVNSEAPDLKVMATIWDYATLKALCGAVNN